MDLESFGIIGIITATVVCVPILILGIILVVIGKKKRKKISSEPLYEGRVVGTLTEATRKNARIGRHSSVRFTEVSYQYSVNDMNYEGSQKDMRLLKGKRYWSRKAEQEALKEAYPIGQQMTVYYKTDEPERSYVFKDEFVRLSHLEDKSLLIAGWIFIGISLFAGVFLGLMFFMLSAF